jgi:2-desacetyl-2-hydroxyethyl bacteriochlorophyllide A dehydrogenase
MDQAVLTGPRQFRLESAGMPEVGPGDVLVKVLASGICASELHSWQDGHGAPYVLGHEVAGEVVEVGKSVSGFRRGDKVTGLFHHGFADYAVAATDRVVALPENIQPVHAFGEPLACVVSAALRTKVELGDRVAIVGLGFMGTLFAQFIRLKGPAQIVGIDIRDDAIAAAPRFGVDVATKADGIAPKDRAEKIGDKGGFDVVIEATGTQAGLDLAADLVRQHGFLSILGYHQGGQRTVNMQLWNFKAFEMLNAHERRPAYRMDCMRRGIALAAAGRINLAGLVTHTYPLAKVGDAFAALETKPPRFIKAVVVAS